MLWLSEVLMQNYDLGSFDELKQLIGVKAKDGEVFFRMDVRPPFSDTPEDWEDRLEAAFSEALDNSRSD
jgi:hypothetical protein